MIEIARVSAQSTVSPERFFARWCDVESHPEWAEGMEWFRLDDPFAVGARGVLKLREGRESPFYVSDIVDGRIYEDTTVLDGAELAVRHEAVALGSGSQLELVASLSGPRAQHFAQEFGDIAPVLAKDLGALVALLESAAPQSSADPVTQAAASHDA